VVAFRDERPTRPDPEVCLSHGLDNEMWAILEACWRKNREERPTSSQVIKALESRPHKGGDSYWDDSFVSILRANLVKDAFSLSVPDIDVTKEGRSFNLSSDRS